ncbi:XdhC family protein [Aquisphaera insulae]|uniref:XdhC family protein n=1 Tax=Aquisphaera insulae TaxID=2712864 RepID=UPI0013EA8EF6|nr:XdhC/CoxI family protein [Aquisphaera insulae]
MRDVVRSLVRILEAGREALVCQVVETRGSTPQKAGALMVVEPEGGQVGTLGGGCVENEVKQRAIRQLGSTGAVLQSFVLDHDYAWADGLICGGKMVTLVESMRGPEPLRYFNSLLDHFERGDGFTEAIVVEPERAGLSRIGARFLVGPSGELAAAWPEVTPPEAVRSRVPAPADRPRPEVRGGIAWIAQWPRVRLVIVGAGHVGQAVANLAAEADFDVWVVDDRAQFANASRFPSAQKILVGPIEDVLKGLEMTPQTYALIVTRGHGHDQEALQHLAPTSAPYVGLIGSRRKIRLIFESLMESGISASDLDRVAAPVGLDIGSQSVIEIAVSVVAELIARRNLGPKGLAQRPGMRIDA